MSKSCLQNAFVRFVRFVYYKLRRREIFPIASEHIVETTDNLLRWQT